ncbi:TetR family transcriptional regulator [Solirubrobacter pauli]|uniref:TetR family transcriptional regulator n=1 Tax=Solirubrobacter pauli TaxID=166793 RepID=A0A660LDZ0_9ACTN|nr:TetR/AcrR family transcriptional regulator [Solirubrobacter pauli]RKQ92130.1 TetR family transcriptional regulator [Solirubrobacter pauli]
MPPVPAKRADAERNRAKILDAARAAFAESDAEVSMAEISRRAGVGMATLYRNFPSRQELIEALYVDEVDAVCAAAALPADSPGAALLAWLRRFYAFFHSKHPLASELLREIDGAGPFFSGNRDRVLAAAAPLLEAAQASGEIRADLTLEQVLELVLAIARVRGDGSYVEPILDAALDGLRTA